MSIKVNLKIFLFAIIFYLTKQIHIYAIIMLFAFCHEMGHLLCGLILGLKPKALKIMPLGVCIEFEVLPEEYNVKIVKANKLQVKKMCIALAGPITNVIIVLITIVFRGQIQDVICQEIVYSNILIAIFNLLPIYPLDGARVIKAFIHILKGRKASQDIINIISNVTVIMITMLSSVAIYYYRNVAILFVIVYLWSIVIIENRKYNIKKRIDKIIENS